MPQKVVFNKVTKLFDQDLTQKIIAAANILSQSQVGNELPFNINLRRTHTISSI